MRSKASPFLADVFQKAADENAECIQSDDTHLLIDIDTEGQHKQFSEVVGLVREKFGDDGFVSIKTWPSKKGPPHMHIYIELSKPQDLSTRIALQAALGSDPVREVLTLDNAINNSMSEPSFLFKPRR